MDINKLHKEWLETGETIRMLAIAEIRMILEPIKGKLPITIANDNSRITEVSVKQDGTYSVYGDTIPDLDGIMFSLPINDLRLDLLIELIEELKTGYSSNADVDQPKAESLP